MKNIKDTIFSQYANSPKILGLISVFNEIIDPSYNINNFYNLVFKLSTATGYGLDNWGRIIGVQRNVKMDVGTDETFGFYTDPDEPLFTPFNTAPFYSTGGAGYGSYSLPDDLYRELIIVRAASNLIYATAPNINKFLYQVFGKKAYYRITDIMKAEYLFEFKLNGFERLIVYTLGLLPQPCGVQIEYAERPTQGIFGFNGSGLNPFNQGTFAP